VNERCEMTFVVVRSSWKVRMDGVVVVVVVVVVEKGGGAGERRLYLLSWLT